ncbi:MAG: hypothetical protein KatS3mg051_1623 [Anaerolineae bacterium]|nr:MAG: hypothetical protein KatS3mg051_1623 [Anaerolineae bacterium]
MESKLTISTDTTTQILTITVQDADRDRAAQIANAVAGQLVEQSPSAAQSEALQQQVQAQIDRIESTIRASEETLRQLEAELARADTEQQRTNIANRIAQERTYKSEAEKLLVSLYDALQKAPNNLITVLEPATRGRPVDRQISLKTILGALSGLVGGIALMTAAERANDTIRTPGRSARHQRRPLPGQPADAGRSPTATGRSCWPRADTCGRRGLPSTGDEAAPGRTQPPTLAARAGGRRARRRQQR